MALAVGGAMLFGFVIVCAFVSAGMPGEDEANASARKVWSYWPALLVCALLAAVIPDRQTIYLIAGSEAGEVVVESEEARAILNDIREVIKSYAETDE